MYVLRLFYGIRQAYLSNYWLALVSGVGGLSLRHIMTAMFFRWLPQHRRAVLLAKLFQAGPDGVAMGSIAEAQKVPAPTLSFHLKELRHAELVDGSRTAGSSVTPRISPR